MKLSHSILSTFAIAFAAVSTVGHAAGRTFYVQEYRVIGTRELGKLGVEEAVYPFLGAGRTDADVEAARAALEKAYKDAGWQTVSVSIPPQTVQNGIIHLQVTEAKVGRLRVKGSRYFSLEQIKRSAPSMAEGRVPNFNGITRDIVSLNQWPDRRVTPVLKPGVEPGTVDIELTVKDTLPLHGSLELNNRRSADTTELRLNGSLSYANLWQLGHTAGFSFQIAPERLDDAQVFSGYYLARFPGLDNFSLMLLATKQDSNVSTLGGAAVVGRGEVLGVRAMWTLPARESFYHSLSLGLDYKHFDEAVRFGSTASNTPITYYPWTLSYNATWAGEKRTTELEATLNFHIRGMGSDSGEFDSKRFAADGDYIFIKGDLTHTEILPRKWELMGKVQGQISSQPLLNSEQFAGGGLGTVRGYLESAALGDNGLIGSLELRTPSLLPADKDKTRARELVLYTFVEGGFLTIRAPLPGQSRDTNLASVGVGGRVRLWDHLGGSVDAGLPLIGVGTSSVHELLLNFRLWSDF